MDNVFEQLGFDKDAAEELMQKSDLHMKLVDCFLGRFNRELSKLFDITPARLIRLEQGRLGEFSLSELRRFVELTEAQ